MKLCPGCGEENPDRFRLCGICGTQLAAAAAPVEVRKTVSVVFSDLKGSTALAERLDPEAVREVLTRYFDTMRGVLESHGAIVEKYIGDAIMAVFGMPRVREDDALRAVRAAWDMQRALERLNVAIERDWGVALAARIGVNTGEVVAGDASSGQRLVSGDTVNVAARLEQAATAMELLISESTLRLVRDAVDVEAVEPLTLKGKSEPVPAYRVVGVHGEFGFTRRRDIRMRGREEELARLEAALQRAVEERRCQAVTICAHAGLGKTKLVEEFLRRTAGRATSLRGRCPAYGEGITFLPLAEIVRQAAGIEDDDEADDARRRIDVLFGETGRPLADRLAAACGLSDTAYPVEETFRAARKGLELLARVQPTIVVLDDIHWAEPTFLRLIEHVVDLAEDAPLLVLCGARHELRDDRPTWMKGRANAEHIDLESLDPEAAALILDELAGDLDIPPAERARILASAGGNPLYLEQMVAMLADGGVTTPDEDAGAAGAACLIVPPTIAALLAARFDRLPEPERAILQIGSVAGAAFPRDAVAELSAAGAREAVDADLAALTRRRFVRPEEGVAGADYRFEHVLVRDTAYGSMLKRARADLHERFADWLAAAPAGRALEQEEVVGYHLEQAYRSLAELGPVDARGGVLGRRASARLTAAGRRALARGDMPAAAGLLQRAMSVLPVGDRDRLELVPDITDALLETGAAGRALEIVDAAEAACAEVGGEVQAIRLRLARHYLRRLSAEHGWAEAVTADLDQAIPILEEAGDHVTLARAWRLVSAVHGAASRYGPTAEALHEAITHARRAGDRRLERRNYHTLAVCELLGGVPVPDAIATCEGLLEDSTGDRRTAALLMAVLGVLVAMRGDVERSRDLEARSRDALEELGNRLTAAVASFFHCRAELLAGDPIAAEAVVRPSLEALQRFGADDYVCTAANLLGDALCAQGRWTEAEEASHVAEAAARDDDTEARSRWRVIRAKATVRAGDPDAVRLAVEGIELARRTDSPILLGLALLDGAEVLELAGAAGEGAAAASEALRHLEAKGDLVSAGRARAILGLVPVAGAAHPRAHARRRREKAPLAGAAGG